jgi:hypothetical protein
LSAYLAGKYKVFSHLPRAAEVLGVHPGWLTTGATALAPPWARIEIPPEQLALYQAEHAAQLAQRVADDAIEDRHTHRTADADTRLESLETQMARLTEAIEAQTAAITRLAHAAAGPAQPGRRKHR